MKYGKKKMSVDGFSIASLGLPKEVTSAQAAANAEHVAQTGNEKVVGKIDRALNKKINNDEEKEHKNQYFEDGFEQSDEDDEEEKNEKKQEKNEKSDLSVFEPENSAGYRPPVIKDPENIVVRYNSKTEKVELFNKVTKKTVESIKTEDFVEMINKLDYNSGVLVNRKI